MSHVFITHASGDEGRSDHADAAHAVGEARRGLLVVGDARARSTTSGLGFLCHD